MLIGFAVEKAGITGELLRSWSESLLFLRTKGRGALRLGGTGKGINSTVGVCLIIQSSDICKPPDCSSFGLDPEVTDSE